MNPNYTPSFIGLCITGLLILIALIYIVKFYKRIDNANWIIVILLLTIAIGIHSMLHAYAEERLDWNPIEGKWVPKRQY